MSKIIEGLLILFNMEKLPTAEEFFNSDVGLWPWQIEQKAIEFAKLHVKEVRSLQQAKYFCGETGYIKTEEWEEILDNIK
jgi:hypothetical protein